MLRAIQVLWATSVTLLIAQTTWGHDILRRPVSGPIPFWALWLGLAILPNAVAAGFALWGEKLVARIWGASMGEGSEGRMRRERKYSALCFGALIAALVMNLALLSTYESIYRWMGGMFSSGAMHGG